MAAASEDDGWVVRATAQCAARLLPLFLARFALCFAARLCTCFTPHHNHTQHKQRAWVSAKRKHKKRKSKVEEKKNERRGEAETEAEA